MPGRTLPSAHQDATPRPASQLLRWRSRRFLTLLLHVLLHALLVFRKHVGNCSFLG